MTELQKVSTDGAPAPAPVLSQGVAKGGLLQVSGQGPVDPATGEYIAAGDVRTQTRRVLDNVAAILEAGGASVADVMMFRVYLTDRENFAAMNETYGRFLSDHLGDEAVLPGRTCVISGLPREDMLVEIDALAVTG